jgi:hypothetical protein
MGYRQLMEGYKYIVDFIYSPRHFYTRVITFLKNYSPPKRIDNTIRFGDIKAFFHSIWSLGIWGEERFYYWKTLLWTLLRRPSLFSVCVRLAIYGYHFRKVFEGGTKSLTRFNPTDERESRPNEGIFSPRSSKQKGREERGKGNEATSYTSADS